jgi:hypothetical protein
MSIKSKLNTLIWYLKRPNYYGQLANLVIQRLKSDPREKTRNKAEKWCQKHSISTNDFLKKLGLDTDELEELFPSEFKFAEEAVKNTPVKMGGPGNIKLLYFLAEELKAKKVLETGVAYGWSSLAILLSLSKRENTKLMSIDMPYAKMGNEDYVGCVIPEQLRSPWKLIRQADRKGLPNALEDLGQIDMCHYDSDKSYAGRMWAYPKLWNRLRNGGYFISDDIGDNLAFHDFCKKINKTPVILKFRTQFVGLLVKK